MPQVKCIGPQGVVLVGKFIYPGEMREISEAQLAAVEQIHPGWFVVVGQEQTPSDETQQSDTEEVNDASDTEHAEQPAAGRRGGAKRRAQ